MILIKNDQNISIAYPLITIGSFLVFSVSNGLHAGELISSC